jgi:hypothetical protein
MVAGGSGGCSWLKFLTVKGTLAAPDSPPYRIGAFLAALPENRVLTSNDKKG